MKLLLGIALAFSHAVSFGASSKEILDDNAKAVVYVEVHDSVGRVLKSGSGVLVSHDGWIVTAHHLAPDETGSLWAVIGERGGTKYQLEFRDADAQFDVALWQLPQSRTCRHAATLAVHRVAQLDRVLILGFPGNLGLTPTSAGISNIQGDLGFYKADGFLEGANSGGPVFDEAGQVIATVQGGTLPGTNNNDLVPIGPAIRLLQKHNVVVGLGSTVPYDNSCYAMCRTTEVSGWKSSVPWKGDTGEFGGGHSPKPECNALIGQFLQDHLGDKIELAPDGATSTTRKDILGTVYYTFHCQGTHFSGPIYKTERSPSCGLFE